MTKINPVENKTAINDFALDCENFANSYRGKDFFPALARLIAEKTGVSYVLVGYPTGEDLSVIKTTVLYAAGKLVEGFEYSLYGTPCENVIGRNCCYYPSGIQQMFPGDKELKELGIESYLGLPVFDKNNKTAGLLVLMDNKLIKNAARLEKALQTLTPRIARELARSKKRALNNVPVVK